MNLQGNRPSIKDKKVFDSLIGVKEQKETLLNNLILLLDKKRIDGWQKKHHKKGLYITDSLLNKRTPMIILSGEVGCGKTVLAHSVGFSLQEKISSKVIVFETPSNIRGSGMVGEISNRITAVFESVKSKLGAKEAGILIIDEADDLATSREQNQAHHEDRAGLNVLIKQIDKISKDNINLAVIMITNRLTVIDPAVYRRAAAIIKFERPDDEKLKEVFEVIFSGLKLKNEDLNDLIKYCNSKKHPYSYSDLIPKICNQAIQKCIIEDKPFSIDVYFEILRQTEPSPLIIDKKTF